MSRCLHAIGARLGRPRATVACPWPKRRKSRHARRIRRFPDELPKDEVELYADEVGIHLIPKIGRDWMLPGQQERVVTPGQNVKRFVAGARDARSDGLHWAEGTHKRSGLFIELLRKIDRAYGETRVIHGIVNN